MRNENSQIIHLSTHLSTHLSIHLSITQKKSYVILCLYAIQQIYKFQFGKLKNYELKLCCVSHNNFYSLYILQH